MREGVRSHVGDFVFYYFVFYSLLANMQDSCSLC